MWYKTATAPDPITTKTILHLHEDPDCLDSEQTRELTRLIDQYQFFHWHLAFPEVHDQGGFDCMLGNPPWARIKLKEKEFFAYRRPEIAKAPNKAARDRLIEALNKPDAPARGQSALPRFPIC